MREEFNDDIWAWCLQSREQLSTSVFSIQYLASERDVSRTTTQYCTFIYQQSKDLASIILLYMRLSKWLRNYSYSFCISEFRSLPLLLTSCFGLFTRIKTWAAMMMMMMALKASLKSHGFRVKSISTEAGIEQWHEDLRECMALTGPRDCPV